MLDPSKALSSLPPGLRDPLLKEYESIVQNYMERRWSPSELSGGLFSEIVYSILDGHAKGTYSTTPFKPASMVDACKKLENNSHVPRSFQILLPRLLPALYEVRNNRGVGHVGGDVDPNHMDALLVVSMCNWIMAELVRVFHSMSVDNAQALADILVERRVPLVWQDTDIKRVLNPKMPIKQQVLLLLASATGKCSVADLQKWTDSKSVEHKKYFTRSIRALHAGRLVELSADETVAQILPPGGNAVTDLIAKSISPPKMKKRRRR